MLIADSTPVDPGPYLKLVESGGPVLVAVVVLAAVVGGSIWLFQKFVWMPSQVVSKEIAASNARAAEEHAKAAAAHENAARFNASLSEANERTSGHLERLSETLLAALTKASTA